MAATFFCLLYGKKWWFISLHRCFQVRFSKNRFKNCENFVFFLPGRAWVIIGGTGMMFLSWDHHLGKIAPPKNNEYLWKILVGRLFSFWNGPSFRWHVISGGGKNRSKCFKLQFFHPKKHNLSFGMDGWVLLHDHLHFHQSLSDRTSREETSLCRFTFYREMW